MAKCKYCHADITRLDKEVCPFCGGSKPLEGDSGQTQDITKVIDQVEHADQIKFHSKVVAAILAIFLGIFGANSFYLGFKKKGFIALAISLVSIAGLGSLIYFVANWHSPFAYLIFYFVMEAIMIGVGVNYLVSSSITDSSGAFLK